MICHRSAPAWLIARTGSNLVLDTRFNRSIVRTTCSSSSGGSSSSRSSSRSSSSSRDTGRLVVLHSSCRSCIRMAAAKDNSSSYGFIAYRWQDTCMASAGGSPAAQIAPAAENNKQPILSVLQRYLPASGGGRVLEVASGTGQHVAYFARELPLFTWQPSDLTAELFGSIAAHTSQGLTNVLRPVVLDACASPKQWRERLGGSLQFDAVIVANMTHISPWSATEGLIAGAAAVLSPGGVLSIYGPFKLHGRFTTESNRAFHERLEARWVGLCILCAVAALCSVAGGPPPARPSRHPPSPASSPPSPLSPQQSRVGVPRHGRR